VTSKGGKIVWLSKDLRHQEKNCSARDTYNTGCPQSSFQRVLDFLGGGGSGGRRPVYVAINAGAMAHGVCPGGAATASSSKGLTAEEILDLALISGTDPNVTFSLTLSLSIYLSLTHTHIYTYMQTYMHTPLTSSTTSPTSTQLSLHLSLYLLSSCLVLCIVTSTFLKSD
jgi:hypothetical protein